MAGEDQLKVSRFKTCTSRTEEAPIVPPMTQMSFGFSPGVMEWPTRTRASPEILG